MRGFILNLIVIAVTAVGGTLLVRIIGRDPHVIEMLVAAAAALVASCLALVPLILTRHASQIAVAQAGLIATLIHMMIAAIFAAVVILGHLPLGQAFTYWLVTLYLATLTAIAVECVRAVKLAHPASAAKQS
jgi:hypothetical protein